MKIKNQTDLINRYNKLIDSVDKARPVLDVLAEFRKIDWLVFIAGKTLMFGRTFEKSIENAEIQIEQPTDYLIKIWGYKDPEAI